MPSSEPVQKISEASTNNADLKHNAKVNDSVDNNAGFDKPKKRKKAERKADEAARGIVKPPKIKRSKAERKAYNMLNPRAVKKPKATKCSAPVGVSVDQAIDQAVVSSNEEVVTKPHNVDDSMVDLIEDEPMDVSIEDENIDSIGDQSPKITVDMEVNPLGLRKAHRTSHQIEGKCSQKIDIWNLGEVNELPEEQQQTKQQILRFHVAIANGDATASVIRSYNYILGDEESKSISIHRCMISDIQLMCLLYTEWLSDDVLNAYLGLLTEAHPKYHSIPWYTFEFSLTTIKAIENKIEGFAQTDVNFQFANQIKEGSKFLLLPLMPEGVHWALCVANIGERTLTWYNSKRSYDAATREQARLLMKLLVAFGQKEPNHPWASIHWTLVTGDSGIQLDATECGVRVAANATAIVTEKATLPTSIEGYRTHMAWQILRSASGVLLPWDRLTKQPTTAFGGVDRAGGSEFIKRDVCASSYLTDHTLEPSTRVDDQCQICGFGTEDLDLETHMKERHTPSMIICLWPGCHQEFTNVTAREDHITVDHELEGVICPDPSCLRRFTTMEEAMRHWRATHPETTKQPRRPILSNYKRQTLPDIQADGIQHGKIYKVGEELRRRRVLYEAYYSPRVHDWLVALGITFQTNDPDLPCRRFANITTWQEENPGGRTHTDAKSFTVFLDERTVSTGEKDFAWWTIFANIPEGKHLDKFIEDTVLTWCELSPKCQRWPCVVFGHLEYVLPPYMDDRSGCLHYEREDIGVCKAEDSSHSHDHCLRGDYGPRFENDFKKSI